MILKHVHFFKSSYSILQCDPLSKTSTSTYSLPNLMDHPIRSPIAYYSRRQKDDGKVVEIDAACTIDEQLRLARS